MFAAKIGDEVGFARSTQYGYQSAGFGTVTKVNGHGHITLSTGKVFDKHGSERGTNYGVQLMGADHLRESIARTTARREQFARAKELQQKVQDMFGYSNNVHVTPESKAELIAMIEAL